jgi:chromosomal replication initiation ATPase DnaA
LHLGDFKMDHLYQKNSKSRRSAFCKKTINLDKKFDLSDKSRAQQITAICDGTIDILAACFSISAQELRGQERYKICVSRVRQVGMYVMHVTLHLTVKEIAMGFNRDRSTVVHAFHLIEDLRDDSEFDGTCTRIENIIAAVFSAFKKEH